MNSQKKKKKQFVKSIAESRDRLVDYTSNIFDLAGLKQGKFNLNVKSEINLIELAKTAINRATPLILRQNKNLSIKLEVKALKPAIIECDDARITQVIYNLLCNSIKYSNHGIIKLSIATFTDHVKISVSDQGVGIPDNEKLEIFMPFFEGSRTKSPAEGKGLGLSIAQEIILLHKGIINVQNNQPTGAIFTIILPYEFCKNFVA